MKTHRKILDLIMIFDFYLPDMTISRGNKFIDFFHHNNVKHIHNFAIRLYD